ncbi:MAG: rRNA small subunit methyltransferase 1 [Bdellovibrionales bacterium]|nr:rRNA small subunit methyltransferase 1 [Bdellovibrionales bacterium]
MSSTAGASKRQKIPGSSVPGLPVGVWVVATPIGNLADLTDRGRLALERAQWIACEDTRRTRSLLSALGLSAVDSSGITRLRRYDRHTEPKLLQEWIQELKGSGHSIAIVSDAGTPAISDPGALLVQIAHQEGVCVTPVPGPSAVAALLSVTGWPDLEAFGFAGFLPRSESILRESLERMSEWAKASKRSWVSIWFESPERVVTSLGWIADCLKDLPGIELCVGKELTKLHEKLFRGELQTVLDQVQGEIEREGALGEWALAIRFPVVDAPHGPSAADSDWLPVLECLLDAEVKTSECARIISHRFGVSRERAYSQAMETKKKRRGG